MVTNSMSPEVVPKEVYESAEDTYLLLKAAMKEARPEDRALEIGCGRGLICRSLAPRVKSILATDINLYAVRMVKKQGVEVVRADLFRGIKTKFDLIIFNPPYLPTTDEERTEDWLNYALDGGLTGRDTISRFLEHLKDYLNKDGRALLLVSSLSGIDEVKKLAFAEGLKVSQIAKERYLFEHLCVFTLRVDGPKQQ